MAIVKYNGKSYVLKVGDSFGDGYIVKDIQEKKVVLNRKGKNITLYNKPINKPLDEDFRHGSAYSGEY
jgi:hypothetical protein